jgi:hypothetical protein
LTTEEREARERDRDMDERREPATA